MNIKYANYNDVISTLSAENINHMVVHCKDTVDIYIDTTDTRMLVLRYEYITDGENEDPIFYSARMQDGDVYGIIDSVVDDVLCGIANNVRHTLGENTLNVSHQLHLLDNRRYLPADYFLFNNIIIEYILQW